MEFARHSQSDSEFDALIGLAAPRRETRPHQPRRRKNPPRCPNNRPRHVSVRKEQHMPINRIVVRSLAFALHCWPLHRRGRGRAASFSLAWSEYPSWSAFGVAHEVKLINGKEGQLGPDRREVESRHRAQGGRIRPVPVHVRRRPVRRRLHHQHGRPQPRLCRAPAWPSCPPRPASAPTPSSSPRPSPTSTSLKGKKVRGLALSVSEYCFARNLEILGKNPKDYSVHQHGPGRRRARHAAEAGRASTPSWSGTRSCSTPSTSAKTAASCSTRTTIPGEIVDMVVVAKSSLEKPGGKAVRLRRHRRLLPAQQAHQRPRPPATTR